MRAGDLVAKRYRLISPLDEGGMGTVWRARHVELEVDVALKFLANGRDNAAARRRFRLEAQAAARLRSPHIVQVLDCGLHGDHPFLAMELLRGESLAQHLTRVGPLSASACLAVVEGIATALSVAHEAGIIHRDLKPANVFLEESPKGELVKVLDFGIAKDIRVAQPSTLTGDGELVGSPPYMSPEQVLGDPLGQASDVWALAVVAFEMLTGKNPFAGDNLAGTFDRILRDPPPDLAELRQDLPPTIAECFKRLFERSPQARPQTADALVRQLREACAVSSTAAASAGASPQQQSTQLAASFALVIGGILATTLLILYGSHDSEVSRAAPATNVAADSPMLIQRQGQTDAARAPSPQAAPSPVWNATPAQVRPSPTDEPAAASGAAQHPAGPAGLDMPPPPDPTPPTAGSPAAASGAAPTRTNTPARPASRPRPAGQVPSNPHLDPVFGIPTQP